MSVRGRLTALYAVVFAAGTGAVLLASYLLLSRHLHATLPEPVAARAMEDVASSYALAVAGLLLAGVAAGWVVAGRALAPLHETLERQATLVEAQGAFVANASHELRSPLTIIRTEADVTLSDPHATAEDLRRMGAIVLEATDRTDALLDSLLLLARSRPGLVRREPVDLADCARRAVAHAAAEAWAAGVRVRLCFAPAPVSGDGALLDRLAANLVENAVRHNERGGNADVHTEVTPDGRARLHVVNDGPLVPAQAVSRLTEPFERLDRALERPGSGLGLSIVRAVAESHGGELHIAARPAGGLDVAVSLELAADLVNGAAGTVAADLDHALLLRGDAAGGDQAGVDPRDTAQRRGVEPDSDEARDEGDAHGHHASAHPSTPT